MTDVLQQAKALIWQHNESGFIHRDATMLLPELVAECERLRQDNKYLGDRWTGQSAKIIDMQKELARWQKVAIEERAKILFYIQYEENPLEQFGLQSEEVKKKYRDRAARELGIDVGDHIRDTTKMMLTAKQRAAIRRIIEPIECMLVDHDTDPEIADAIKVLRSMLSQSRPAWEITEGRRRAIELAQYGFRGFPQNTMIDALIVVLQAMLEEAK